MKTKNENKKREKKEPTKNSRLVETKTKKY